MADLRNALADIEGVRSAAIPGSFARNGEKAEGDIDVLALGDVPELKTNARLRPLARKYGRAFNASVFAPAQFRQLLAQDDGFATEVMAQPHISLIGDLDAGT